MPHIVTDRCQRCRFTECVTVCPVSCFHWDDRMLYVDPVECISCRACLTACPVNAIYDIEDLPPEKVEWIEINARRSALLPKVTEKQDPFPGSELRKAALGFGP